MTAFQLFKLLMNNIDTLIIKMTLTDDILNTQFYDKVDEVVIGYLTDGLVSAGNGL